MPLAFESRNCGTIAFGFFNIDSDMLLLDGVFFFSTEFTKVICDLADAYPRRPFTAAWQGYHISRPQDIGNLMNAIHGIEHNGFIGQVYKLFPFPKDPRLFRQKPEGTATRDSIERIARRFTQPAEIRFKVDGRGESVDIGRYKFSRKVFQDMIIYVWRGGYPRWANDSPPDYIQVMKDIVDSSSHPLFEGIAFRVP